MVTLGLRTRKWRRYAWFRDASEERGTGLKDRLPCEGGVVTETNEGALRQALKRVVTENRQECTLAFVFEEQKVVLERSEVYAAEHAG